MGHAGLVFWVIGLKEFFCIFVRFCCEQAYTSNRFGTYPALRVLPGGNQVDGLPPAFSFEVKSADEAEPDFYEIGRQPNFEGIFNAKSQKIGYHKKIFARPLGLLGLASRNDS